jgi:outer membrane protein assembly factor BamC
LRPDANAEARIARAGTQRWLVVKTTPEIAWNTTRQFWSSVGFAVAVEQPTLGIMETDWAENRADVPNTWLQQTIGKYVDIFGSTYKRDKFRTRIERGNEPGTVDIYVRIAGRNRFPPARSTMSRRRASRGQVMPPDPGLEAEMLARLMLRFGATEAQAAASFRQRLRRALRNGASRKVANGSSQLVVDDSFDRAWRRVGLALDRVGFTVVDRDRSKGTYFVRYSNPEAEGLDEGQGLPRQADVLEGQDREARAVPHHRRAGRPEQPRDRAGPGRRADKSANGEKILALLKDQLK